MARRRGKMEGKDGLRAAVERYRAAFGADALPCLAAVTDEAAPLAVESGLTVRLPPVPPPSLPRWWLHRLAHPPGRRLLEAVVDRMPGLDDTVAASPW